MRVGPQIDSAWQYVRRINCHYPHGNAAPDTAKLSSRELSNNQQGHCSEQNDWEADSHSRNTKDWENREVKPCFERAQVGHYQDWHRSWPHVDHGIIRSTAGRINKVDLVHLQPRKVDLMTGYKNKNTSRCNRQDLWQISTTVQDQLSEVTFVYPACQLRRFVTIHSRAFTILKCTDPKVHPDNRASHRFQAQVLILCHSTAQCWPGQEHGNNKISVLTD